MARQSIACFLLLSKLKFGIVLPLETNRAGLIRALRRAPSVREEEAVAACGHGPFLRLVDPTHSSLLSLISN